MLQFKDEPKLMLALDRFLSNYYGERVVKPKRDLREIAAWKIPKSLKYFYSFAEKYPGLIDLQDGLFINDGTNSCRGELYISESLYRRYFTHIVTKVEGDDPPVWIEQIEDCEEHIVSKLVCNSLSQFLTAHTLRQASLSSTYFYDFIKMNKGIELEDLLSAVEQQGDRVSLLWETENFWDIFLNKTSRIDSFYSVEDAILICSNGFCATNHKNSDRLWRSLLWV